MRAGVLWLIEYRRRYDNGNWRVWRPRPEFFSSKRKAERHTKRFFVNKDYEELRVVKYTRDAEASP